MTTCNNPESELFGYCHCGCGEKTKPANKSDSSIGKVKGNPYMFVMGHKTKIPIENKFWAKVPSNKDSNECWEWLGTKSSDGYAELKYKRKHIRANRIMWEMVNGQIPNGMIICHRCDNPACVNPHHLFLGTQMDNMHDKIAKGRHSYGENHKLHKLTIRQVKQIRKQVSERTATMSQIARNMNVSLTTISSIVHEKTWKECL